MNQEIRNKLRNVVTHCRKLLEDSVSQELEGKYGIFAKKDQVTADQNAKMPHLTEEEQAARKDILDHFGHVKARGFKPKEALDQLVREIAFTHLNRLCAYKMMEAREVYVGGQKFREAVSRGINSNGVKFYLADHRDEERLFNTGHQDVAYRHFLDWLGGLLSDEIGVLFNPNDPANRLYPRQKTLDEVLDLLNGGGIKPEETELREGWPKIWTQDETIGWVYQYFTPKELRDQARKESAAPRNSYELAFRNQFFTPRYVVEFLVDNTVGRIWFEMRKGDTKLKDQCQYMVRRPTEHFLKDGEQPPKDAAKESADLSQAELLKLPVYIPYRPKKDPRELRILDPASGSGHFLLYCFDLLLTIYEEAYNDPNLGPALQSEYETLDALRRDVPRLILAHNLHGIDIDLRASQIAALALWLRCQRAYKQMGITHNRPKITRSNLVCAEPMPGEEQLLNDFVRQLEPNLLGQIVEVVFKRMKLAGEAGSLLQIEEEIREVVASAKKQWVRESTHAMDRKGQPLLFTQAAMDRLLGKAEQSALFDLSGISDAQFFEQAELKVVEALRQYSSTAQNGHRLQKRLFTDDAERGFAFVDLCHKQFDVALTNPPFGLPPIGLNTSGTTRFDTAISKNLAWAMMERCAQLTGSSGYFGAIVDRTIFQKSSYEQFRTGALKEGSLDSYVDLGIGVLDDADVMTCCYTFSNQKSTTATVFFDERQCPLSKKGSELAERISGFSKSVCDGIIVRRLSDFDDVPFSSLSYWVPQAAIEQLFKGPTIDDAGFQVAGGLQCNDVFRFIRILPEIATREIIDKKWVPFYNGGPFSLYWLQTPQYVLWENNGAEIKQKIVQELGDSPSRFVKSEKMYFKPGLAGGKRGEYFDVHVLAQGTIFSNEGRVFEGKNRKNELSLLAYLNSHLSQNLVNVFCGQHKGSEYLKRVPMPVAWITNLLGVNDVLTAINQKRLWSSIDECGHEFISPWSPIGSHFDPSASLAHIAGHLATLLSSSNQIVRTADRSIRNSIAKHISEELIDEVENSGWTEMPRPADKIENIADAVACGTEVVGFAENVIQYIVGVVYGRWDVRRHSETLETVDQETVFNELPPSPRGMLQVSDLHQSQYPLAIISDGILVHDPEHPDDVERRVRTVIEAVWNIKAEEIEKELCDVLGVPTLREYFRRPNSTGFWGLHSSRYSKSRRKSPIYWLLQSSKANYALWLYYHRYDKDLLFKALVNYVEPKVRLEENRIEGTRRQLASIGQSGKEAKRVAKDLERQEDFLAELRDFSDKLRRAANLHLVPDLNDGVVLNIAPLHELVPWNEAEKYWEELLAGEHEWSSIGKQLRQNGLVK